PLLRLVVGMAHLVAGERALAADIALERHWISDRGERRQMPAFDPVSSRGDLLAPAQLQGMAGAGAGRQQRSLDPETGVDLPRGEDHPLVGVGNGPDADRLRMDSFVRPQEALAVLGVEGRRLV